MKIQVLGSGCPTCKSLYEMTKKAVKEMRLDTEVEYLIGDEGMQRIIGLGAMGSPVLSVNDSIAMTGFTSDILVIQDKIKEILETK